MMRIALISAAALLAACGQKPAEEAPAEPVAAEAAPSLATATRSVGYSCDKDLPVTAVYGTNAEGQSDVSLVIKGQNFNLVQTVAASGSRYASPQGLEPGKGLIWWEKGDEAMLQEIPSDKMEDMEAAVTIRTCRVKSEEAEAAAMAPDAAAGEAAAVPAA
ncbi:MliC family protein [Sandaracinobacteroides sp. A072]|uniref:MliC family protein n=1 Tax=Sandaracinobacteroides sp. A072 TaxID=3461146 RepID=UPI0040421278